MRKYNVVLKKIYPADYQEESYYFHRRPTPQDLETLAGIPLTKNAPLSRRIRKEVYIGDADDHWVEISVEEVLDLEALWSEGLVHPENDVMNW